MPHPRRWSAPLALALIVTLSALNGCDSTGVVDPSPATAIRIAHSPADLAPAWSLATVDSTIARGQGDSLLTGLEPGTYWVLFEPEPGRHSPVENPFPITLHAGTTARVDAQWRAIEGKTGTVLVEEQPEDFGARWNLTGPAGFFAAGTGSRTLPGRAPGTYSIVWEARDEYRTPPAGSAELLPGTELSMRAVYMPLMPEGGYVEIDPSPDEIQAGWTLTTPEGDVISARGDSVLTGLPTGKYSLVWSPMPGMDTPAPVTGVLDPYSSLRFATTYVTPIHPVGTIEVEVTPSWLPASWQLFSDKGLHVTGSGDTTFVYLPTARYAIAWGDVPGFVTPAMALVTLEKGDVLELVGNYQVDQELLGDIHVDPNPDSIAASWRLVSETGVVFEGVGDSTLTGQAPGTYTLYWGDVEGFVTPTPNPVTRTLEPGQSLGFGIQ